MSAPNTIAVIFDFDDTLTDESTTKLLERFGIDPVTFWQEQNAKLIARDGWDPVLAYMSLMLENIGVGRPFGKLTNADLRAFGGTLRFYPGVQRLFGDLRRIADDFKEAKPKVEFHVVTSGLEEVVRGSRIADELTGVFGSQFAERDGEIRYVKNAVSFTEKTRFLFEINKGTRNSRLKPYSVNEFVPPDKRRVPFQNMIYIGDGLTDVPCFSLLKQNGGTMFGVFDPSKEGSPKKGWEKLAAPKRVDSIHSPRYGKKDDLGSLLRVAFNQICAT